ncbi:MAG TPA: hypothetical protein VG842_07265 [Sediminibacterium sp.]|nr:hypothetical protein [Sediminibacterium sp.]
MAPDWADMCKEPEIKSPVFQDCFFAEAFILIRGKQLLKNTTVFPKQALDDPLAGIGCMRLLVMVLVTAGIPAKLFIGSAANGLSAGKALFNWNGLHLPAKLIGCGR